MIAGNRLKRAIAARHMQRHATVLNAGAVDFKSKMKRYFAHHLVLNKPSGRRTQNFSHRFKALLLREKAEPMRHATTEKQLPSWPNSRSRQPHPLQKWTWLFSRRIMKPNHRLAGHHLHRCASLIQQGRQVQRGRSRADYRHLTSPETIQRAVFRTMSKQFLGNPR